VRSFGLVGVERQTRARTALVATETNASVDFIASFIRRRRRRDHRHRHLRRTLDEGRSDPHRPQTFYLAFPKQPDITASLSAVESFVPLKMQLTTPIDGLVEQVRTALIRSMLNVVR
jgi:hypothetical protein